MTTALVGLASAATIATTWSAGLTPRQPTAQALQVTVSSQAGVVTADPATPPKTAAATPSSKPSASAGGKPRATPTAGGATSKAAPAPAPAPAPKPAPTSGRVDGALVSTQYGQVQVRVRFTGKRITSVTALHLTDSSGTSVMISQRAAPILRSEAMTKQSAQIDMVSGATYTSEGYIQSLQSAIDAAHLA